MMQRSFIVYLYKRFNASLFSTISKGLGPGTGPRDNALRVFNEFEATSTDGTTALLAGPESCPGSDRINLLYDLARRQKLVRNGLVDKALGDLTALKDAICDYETLLKAVEIFYTLGELGPMKDLLNHFSSDIPYIPNHLLVPLTRFYLKHFRADPLVRSLQIQLYRNLLNFADKGPENSNTQLEGILYCFDEVEDLSIVHQALSNIEFSNIDSYPDLLTPLKLYHLLLSSGNRGISGFASASQTRLELLMSSSSPVQERRAFVNCLRYLVKTRKYEEFDLTRSLNLVPENWEYTTKDLILLLKDLHRCPEPLDTAYLLLLVRATLEDPPQLSKDDFVFLLKFLTRNRLPLEEPERELLNFHVLLHTPSFGINDYLVTLEYYSTNRTPEALRVVTQMYRHLNRFDSRNSHSDGFEPPITVGTKIGSAIVPAEPDVNGYIYVLGRFMLYFHQAGALNGLMLKRYTRTIESNHLNLNNRTHSYSLYVYYKLGHNPKRLLNLLLPILNSNLGRFNPLDTVQILLFFTRFRHEGFYPALIARVQDKLVNGEFNEEQLVILSRCLYSYKRTLATSLFTAISARLKDMTTTQICTVLNSYAKSRLENQLLAQEATRIISSNFDHLKYQDVLKLLLPIKLGCLDDAELVERIRTSWRLEPSHYFDAFGQVPEGDLSDDQVLKCLLSLSDKERSAETDEFARTLFSRAFKIAQTLSQPMTSTIMRNIHSYGYVKPKIHRILTNRLSSFAARRSRVAEGAKEDKEKQLFSFFRHISEGPPHLTGLKSTHKAQ